MGLIVDPRRDHLQVECGPNKCGCPGRMLVPMPTEVQNMRTSTDQKETYVDTNLLTLKRWLAEWKTFAMEFM